MLWHRLFFPFVVDNSLEHSSILRRDFSWPGYLRSRARANAAIVMVL